MTYIELSNDKNMAKRRVVKKHTPARKAGGRDKRAMRSYPSFEDQAPAATVQEASYSFVVTRSGKKKEYVLQVGYGYFIPSLRRAESLTQVSALVDTGLPAKEVEPVIRYLGLTVPDIARAASVSPSTVSRWRPHTSIGAPGSSQFFRIDELIKKGVELFGGPEEFRGWLQSANIALGNHVPAKLITSYIGIELVDEALDALHYGNVM